MFENPSIPTQRFLERFPNEDAARVYFEKLRWSGGVSCSHCGSDSVAVIKNQNPMPYRCRTCRQYFSVRTGTILADSRIALRTWLLAIYILTSASTSIKADDMAKILGVSRKSTDYLAQRIHETYSQKKTEFSVEKIAGNRNSVLSSTKNEQKGKIVLTHTRQADDLEKKLSMDETRSAVTGRSDKLKPKSRKDKINA